MKSRRTTLAPPLIALLALASAVVRAQAPEETKEMPRILAVLQAWTAGHSGKEMAAFELLRHVETEYRVREPTWQTKDAKIVRKLAKAEPGVSIPVIGLYTEAHSLAIERGATRAAENLRRETIRLIQEYTRKVRNQEGWRLGARFYIELAAPLPYSGNLDLAMSLLDDALDLDGENVHALHAAAAMREKFGQYGIAEDLFRRLLDLQPTPEVRLRLALCRARSGKSKPAERLLAGLARAESPQWIRAIAYQEWSQLRMRKGDPAMALTVAREGHEVIPQDDSLAILLAFMAGPRDPMSRSLIVRLTTEPTGADAAARGLYNLWPLGITGNEALLERDIAARMPLLVDAVERESSSRELAREVTVP